MTLKHEKNVIDDEKKKLTSKKILYAIYPIRYLKFCMSKSS